MHVPSKSQKDPESPADAGGPHFNYFGQKHFGNDCLVNTMAIHGSAFYEFPFFTQRFAQVSGPVTTASTLGECSLARLM